jgi:glutathione S-transferase
MARIRAEPLCETPADRRRCIYTQLGLVEHITNRMSTNTTVHNRWVYAAQWTAAPAIAAGWSSGRVLITLPSSHFCEKARWALDHAGLSYRELGFAPVVHKAAVRIHGSRTAPILVGKQTLRQSSDIVRLASSAAAPGRRLYPADADARREIEDVVARLDETLGLQVRLWFYCWAVADPRRFDDWVSLGLGRPQRLLVRVLSRRMAILIADILSITERTGDEARELIDAELDTVSATLADGRRYIGGDGFSAADLTFAALTGPLLYPPGYGGARFSLPPVPDELAPQINAWRTTPAGQLALRVYRDHRAAAAAPRDVGSRGGAKLARD